MWTDRDDLCYRVACDNPHATVGWVEAHVSMMLGEDEVVETIEWE